MGFVVLNEVISIAAIDNNPLKLSIPVFIFIPKVLVVPVPVLLN